MKRMLNAIVAASVIAAVNAQESQRTQRAIGTTQRPTAPSQGERAFGRRQATTETTTGNEQAGTAELRRPRENARTEDGERPDSEAMVFRFLAEHPDFLERLIARADADGDGRLSPDERAAMREHLQARATERREDREERRDDKRDAHEERVENRTERREERRDDMRDNHEERVDDRTDRRDERRDEHADNRRDRRDERRDGQTERAEARGRGTPPRTGPGGRQRQ